MIVESQLYHGILQHSPLAMVRWDEDLRIVEWNVRARDLFGWRENAVLGKPLSEVLALPGEAAAHARRMRSLLTTGEHGFSIGSALTKDGRTLTCEWHSRVLRDETGQVQGGFTFALDITDRRRMDEALRESEAKLNATLRSMGEAVVTADLDGRVTRMNPGAERLTGWRLAEAHGRPLSEVLMATEEATGAPCAILGIAAADLPADGLPVQALLRHRSSGLVPISLSITAIRDQARNLHGRVLTFRDQTLERAAERDLKEKEARYRAIVEDQTEFVLRLSPTLRFTFANQAVCRYLRLEVDRLLTLRMEDLLPEEGPGIARRLAQLNSSSSQTSLEHRWKGADGSLRHLLWDVRALFSQDGSLTEYQAVGRDITAERRAEEAVAKAEREAAVGRLAAVVAHEVNNPLGAITAHLSAMRASDDLPAIHRETLGVLARQVERIASTVQKLLRFTRQRENRGLPVRLGDLVEAVAELYAGRFRAQGLRLESDLPPRLPTLHADVDLLQEVLINLVENACDAVPRGGCIAIRAEQDADLVQLLVEDDGPGLGDDPERVFTPFYTTKTKGTGLGLAIARRICVDLGGSLEAGNRPRGGAWFRIRLPAGPALRQPGTPA